jgi:uncharacterized membrane protein
MMSRIQFLGAGLGLGAALAYFLDPDRGRRRRARVRDAITHAARVTNDVVGKTSRDLGNRASGLASAVQAIVKGETVSDAVLVERVRTKLGRVVSHPRAIEVTAAQGRVTLSGLILASEVDPLFRCVRHVRGVTGVENRLDARDRSDDTPALQGGTPRTGEAWEFLQSSWSPSARLLAGLAGGALTLWGMRRRGMTGAAFGAVGGSLLARGLTNLELRDLAGLGGGRGINVQKTINIQAPVERVYEIWSHPENFPHFMSRVREVTDLGEGRYHWTVEGPAGVPCSWTGAITKQSPNELLEFISEPGSVVEQHGVVRFEPKNGGTRVDVKMSYRPPAGAAGHIVARLFGADPRSEMIADLMRMKSFIETGRQPHDAAERRAGGSTAPVL